MAKIDWKKTPIRPMGYDTEGNIQWGVREEIHNGKRIQQVTSTTARMELTKGQWTLVDIDDLPKLKMYSWRASEEKRRYRAFATINNKTTPMSRFVLGYTGANDVDHLNRDSLDNRKENLRVATRSENIANNAFDGIRFRYGKWQARIMCNYKWYHATFPSKEEAVVWREAKKKELFP